MIKPRCPYHGQPDCSVCIVRAAAALRGNLRLVREIDREWPTRKALGKRGKR